MNRLNMLRTANDPLMRCRAAVQLALQQQQDAIPLLIATTHDPDWSVRQNAAWALGQLRAEAGVPALDAMLASTEDDEQVLYVAALALIRVNSAAAHACLAVHRDSSHESVRRVVAAAYNAASYLNT